MSAAGDEAAGGIAAYEVLKENWPEAADFLRELHAAGLVEGARALRSVGIQGVCCRAVIPPPGVEPHIPLKCSKCGRPWKEHEPWPNCPRPRETSRP